jgi:hypothetical protein
MAAGNQLCVQCSFAHSLEHHFCLFLHCYLWLATEREFILMFSVPAGHQLCVQYSTAHYLTHNCLLVSAMIFCCLRQSVISSCCSQCQLDTNHNWVPLAAHLLMNASFCFALTLSPFVAEHETISLLSMPAGQKTYFIVVLLTRLRPACFCVVIFRL